MPLPKLTQKERELFLSKRIKELERIYKNAQDRLSKRLAGIGLTKYNRKRTQLLLKQTRAQIISLNAVARRWAKRSMPMAYFEGADLAALEIKRNKISRFVNLDAQIHTSAVNALVDDVTVTLIQANNSMLNNVRRVIRQTQQKIIEDREISKMIAQGIIEGETRRQTSDAILNAFRQRMADNQFIVINGRNYRPDKYARLVARTRTREAASRGTINTALNYGMDLVLISDHDTPTALCQKYEGKVFSISGEHPSYPILDRNPPFHPNCKHVVVPITEEAIAERGL